MSNTKDPREPLSALPPIAEQDRRSFLRKFKRDEENRERIQAEVERQRRAREVVAAVQPPVEQRDELTVLVDQRVTEATLAKSALTQPAGPQPGSWAYEQMVAQQAARHERIAAARADEARRARERQAEVERQRIARDQAAEKARGELHQLEQRRVEAEATVARLAPELAQAEAVLERIADLERQAVTA